MTSASDSGTSLSVLAATPTWAIISGVVSRGKIHRRKLGTGQLRSILRLPL
jgi:hypothetical protein